MIHLGHCGKVNFPVYIWLLLVDNRLYYLHGLITIKTYNKIMATRKLVTMSIIATRLSAMGVFLCLDIYNLIIKVDPREVYNFFKIYGYQTITKPKECSATDVDKIVSDYSAKKKFNDIADLDSANVRVRRNAMVAYYFWSNIPHYRMLIAKKLSQTGI